MNFNWTTIIVAGVASSFSIVGAYIGVRITLSELKRSADERLQRHSNRLRRLEDFYFKLEDFYFKE